MSNEIEKIIAAIVEAENINDAALLFSANFDLLENYIFFVSHDESSAILPSHAIDKDFKNTCAIRGLYQYKNVYIISSETIDSFFLKKEQIIPIDYSISLDTQAVSYFHRFFIDPEHKELPPDFKEFFKFIADPEVNADPMPHMIENIYNLKNGGNIHAIYDVKYAYEKFRNIDYNYYIKEGKFRFLIDDSEIKKIAQQQISREIHRLSDSKFFDEYEKKFNLQYIIILIIAVIRWKYPKKHINTMLYKYFEMCQEYIGVIPVRDANLAYTVFLGKTKFYSEIEKNSDDFIRKLKGMAWDIFHFRHLESVTTMKLNDYTDYFFPAICSFDKRFVQLIEFYKLKGLAYKKGTSRVYPVYSFGIEDMIELTDKGRRKIEEDFFNNEVIMDRKISCESTAKNFKETILKLETEFFELKDNK